VAAGDKSTDIHGVLVVHIVDTDCENNIHIAPPTYYRKISTGIYVCIRDKKLYTALICSEFFCVFRVAQYFTSPPILRPPELSLNSWYCCFLLWEVWQVSKMVPQRLLEHFLEQQRYSSLEVGHSNFMINDARGHVKSLQA
jgi:hypothetical protein